MKIFPAIDLYSGNAVRLMKGEYEKMTVYNTDPVSVAKDFEAAGAEYIHLVDLEGAKFSGTPNFGVVERIVKNTSLSAEIGGGIRDMQTVEKYINAGVDRVILGTAAVTDSDFLARVADRFGDKIAVGVDLKDGFVAIRGWLEKTCEDGFEFCRKMQNMGVGTIICTDISKDGMMMGTNRELYRKLSAHLSVNVVASGGVSSLDDIRALRELGIFGAIIGKAYYTGAIDLKEALTVAK